MKIEWGKRAEKQFFKAIEYIREDSEQNAEKVARTLVALINKIPENSERFALEQYKVPNDGSYRYFTKYHYRVSYRVIKSGIKIIRIRHTKQKPDWI